MSFFKQAAPAIRTVLRKVLRGSADPAAWHYADSDFLSGYIAHTNERVAHDPKAAIGGRWDEIGQLQFDFMKAMGMHRMMDLGCGTLRGGRHFIRYLNASNYTGVDIAPSCIAAARQLVAEKTLEHKRPKLLLNEPKDLKFEQFHPDKFDFTLAQPVLTHLPEAMITECFQNIQKVLAAEGAFYFTYWESSSYRKFGIKDFAYP